MRRLSPAGGLTLVELMVAITIAGLMLAAAAPHLAEYSANARLREAGHILQAEALAAQSEAIKRNRIVRLSTAGAAVRVAEAQDATNPVQLRSRSLPTGVSAGTVTVDFSPRGFPVDRSVSPSLEFAAAAIDLGIANATCSADYRCPGLRVDAGGGVRLCPNKLSDC